MFGHSRLCLLQELGCDLGGEVPRVFAKPEKKLLQQFRVGCDHVDVLRINFCAFSGWSIPCVIEVAKYAGRQDPFAVA